MLDKESSVKLLSAILEQIEAKYPNSTGAEKLLYNIAQVAADVSVISLQEYERLNQQP